MSAVVLHLAGPVEDGLQKCLRCHKVMAQPGQSNWTEGREIAVWGLGVSAEWRDVSALGEPPVKPIPCVRGTP